MRSIEKIFKHLQIIGFIRDSPCRLHYLCKWKDLGDNQILIDIELIDENCKVHLIHYHPHYNPPHNQPKSEIVLKIANSLEALLMSVSNNIHAHAAFRKAIFQIALLCNYQKDNEAKANPIIQHITFTAGYIR